ncbi:NAD(P)/FAD-dependent oxidoreductase [Rhizobium sp. 2YAF20]|uniref:NAD(P)/FAD-dependent oxidoreductase n=1 Tax=Rhizobium sp. 2YAF20 TaxID=3233027 RepID=UPI003F9C51A1
MPGGLIIIGASHAGVQLAVKCREMGYREPITLINGEKDFPYQKPPLSKGFLTQNLSTEDIALRSDRFFALAQIRLLSGKRCVKLDRRARAVELEDGRQLRYAALAFATGSNARSLPQSFGAVPSGVVNLRSLNDARFVRDALISSKKVVIVGAGLIGLEVASTLASIGCRVALVEFQKRVMARSCSPHMSVEIERLHRIAGVEMHLEAGIAEIHAKADRLKGLTLTNGARLEANICLFAIGAFPNIDLARDAGLACENGILVDQFMRTSDKSILAVGDCTAFPSIHLGIPIRLESIQNAHEQAASAAATLVGACRPYLAPPVFWSDQRACKFQMVGFLDGVDMTIKREGNTDAFSLWHFAERHLRAVESINNTHEQALAHQILAKQAHLTPEQLADPGFELRTALLA